MNRTYLFPGRTFPSLVLLMFLLGACSGSPQNSSEASPEPSLKETDQVSKAKTYRNDGDLYRNGVNTGGMMASDTIINRLRNEISDLTERTGFQERKTGLKLRVSLAQELLRDGRLNQALRATQEPIDLLQTSLSEKVTPVLRKLYQVRMLSRYYSVIQKQCNEAGEPDRCFLSRFPWKRVPERTVREIQGHLMGTLAFFPQDLSYRLLLNLLSQKLGTPTESLPAPWRFRMVPETANESDPLLRNRADPLGVDQLGRAGSVAMADFNGDGLQDLMVTEWGYPNGQVTFFRQTDGGTFVDATEEAGLEDVRGGLNLTQADYDNDGDMDVYLLRGAWPNNQPGDQSNVLLENQGGGHFEPVTRQVGLYNPAPTQSAAWADFNRDGWVDLFVGNEALPADTEPSKLYLNRGGTQFVEVSTQAGIALDTFVIGASWGHVNGDDRPDLYVSVFNEENRLYVNRGVVDGTVQFRERARKYGVADPKASFATGFLDYDNDGLDDLFVATFRKRELRPSQEYVLNALERGRALPGPILYHNTGNKFEDVSDRLGDQTVNFTMGTNAGDLNNDGYPDILLGTGAPALTSLVPNRLFINHRGDSFVEETFRYGVDHFMKGHGAAIGDLTGDGFQDVYQVQGGGYPVDRARNVLLVNTRNEHNWIQLNFTGTKSPRSGRGVEVSLLATSPNRQERIIHHRVTTGFSFGSSPLRAEIGLGEMTQINKLTVDWPASGSESQVFRNLEVNRTYRINENRGLLSPSKTDRKE